MEEPNGTRTFPIQGDGGFRDKAGRMVYQKPTIIPWWLAEEAYKNYNCKSSQSLERLAERGGFGREELLTLLRGQHSHPHPTEGGE